jgi:hypothetical protein
MTSYFRSDVDHFVVNMGSAPSYTFRTNDEPAESHFGTL